MYCSTYYQEPYDYLTYQFDKTAVFGLSNNTSFSSADSLGCSSSTYYCNNDGAFYSVGNDPFYVISDDRTKTVKLSNDNHVFKKSFFKTFKNLRTDVEACLNKIKKSL